MNVLDEILIFRSRTNFKLLNKTANNCDFFYFIISTGGGGGGHCDYSRHRDLSCPIAAILSNDIE